MTAIVAIENLESFYLGGNKYLIEPLGEGRFLTYKNNRGHWMNPISLDIRVPLGEDPFLPFDEKKWPASRQLASLMKAMEEGYFDR